MNWIFLVLGVAYYGVIALWVVAQTARFPALEETWKKQQAGFMSDVRRYPRSAWILLGISISIWLLFWLFGWVLPPNQVTVPVTVLLIFALPVITISFAGLIPKDGSGLFAGPLLSILLHLALRFLALYVSVRNSSNLLSLLFYIDVMVMIFVSVILILRSHLSVWFQGVILVLAVVYGALALSNDIGHMRQALLRTGYDKTGFFDRQRMPEGGTLVFDTHDPTDPPTRSDQDSADNPSKSSPSKTDDYNFMAFLSGIFGKIFEWFFIAIAGAWLYAKVFPDQRRPEGA